MYSKAQYSSSREQRNDSARHRRPWKKAQEEVIKCMETVQQYEDEVKEAETRLEQVKADLAGNGGEPNPQENKLNLVEQLLKSAMMQTALEVKETTDPGRGDPQRGRRGDTTPAASRGKQEAEDRQHHNRQGDLFWHWYKQ